MIIPQERYPRSSDRLLGILQTRELAEIFLCFVMLGFLSREGSRGPAGMNRVARLGVNLSFCTSTPRCSTVRLSLLYRSCLKGHSGWLRAKKKHLLVTLPPKGEENCMLGRLIELALLFLQQQRRERELRKQQEREQRRRYEEMEQLRREEERRHAEREQVCMVTTTI